MKRIILAVLLTVSAGFLWAAESGIASWYTADRPDALTANGEIFDNTALSAAHKTLAFGSIVRVTNNANGKSIEVRINDRGPYVENRIIDLTPEGARQLGYYDEGIADVTVEVISEPEVPETLYINGSETGWYTLQVGTYTNMENAWTVYTNIKSAGLRPTVPISWTRQGRSLPRSESLNPWSEGHGTPICDEHQPQLCGSRLRGAVPDHRLTFHKQDELCQSCRPETPPETTRLGG